MTQTQKWPEKMTKTRQEMTALGLPGGRKKDGATVIENTITDQDRWTTTHDLIFQLPDMPDDLAYSTWYREGSTEQQDEKPWEHESAECVLVRKVPKVIESWTTEPVPEPEQVPSPLTYVPMSAARQIRNTIYRNCDAERERQIEKGYDAAHDDDHADGEISGLAAAVAAQDAQVAHPVLRDAAQHILDKWPGYADRIRIAHALLTADLERLARAKGQPEPRIEVGRLDPDNMAGIAQCDDGDGGWVVLAVQADPDGPGEVIAPVGDDIGAIVYVDILDAAEVLKTGIVWKHDMGEGEPDDGPTPVRLDKTISPIGKDSAFEVRIVDGAKFTPRLSWFTDAARVFDERTGKMLKDRNPEAPPCQVVVQYGPERSEFFVKRNSAEVDFNFGPLNRMINGMMDRLVKTSLNASEDPDADEDQP